MKKLISLLLLAAMVLSLCACGGNEPVSQEEVIEAVEEAAPAIEELLAQAAGLLDSGSFDELLGCLNELEGSGEALVTEMMALCHYYGYGTDIDPDKAVDMFSELAEQGSIAAKAIIAEATNSGNGAPRDPEQAKKLYAELIELAKAMDESEVLAGTVYNVLSECYAKGFGTELDMDKATEAAQKALNSGVLSLLEKAEAAGFIYSHGQDLIDVVESELNDSAYTTKDLFDPAKTANMTEPEKFIKKLEKGEALKEEAEKVFTLIKDDIFSLADEGNIIAMKLVGDYYYEGLDGEPTDYEKALECYTECADLDYAPAQAQLALMYQEGHGVDVNYEMAMEWNNRAAQQGNAQGQAQIGYLYHMGLGVTQNLDEAGRWYSRAADQGDLWAQAKLAQTEITNPQLAFEFHA